MSWVGRIRRLCRRRCEKESEALEETLPEIGERQPLALGPTLVRSYEEHFWGLFILKDDKERTILHCNGAAAKMFGFSREELIGQSIRVIHQSDFHFLSMGSSILKAVDADGHADLGEHEFRKKEGTVLYATCNAFPFYTEAGVRLGWHFEVRKNTLSFAALRGLNSRLQEGHEEALTLLSDHVFDDFGQILMGFQYQLAAVAHEIQNSEGDAGSKGVLNRLEEMRSSLRAILDSTWALRSLSGPTMVKNLGLSAALRWFAEDFQVQTGIVCAMMDIREIRTIDSRIAMVIYRICQEIFSNIKTHSQADCFSISMTAGQESLLLNVSDNGCGIPPGCIDNPCSLGLLAIREWARGLGGTVTFSGDQDCGTTVLLILPFPAVC